MKKEMRKMNYLMRNKEIEPKQENKLLYRTEEKGKLDEKEEIHRSYRKVYRKKDKENDIIEIII